jgi:hypothetical protein
VITTSRPVVRSKVENFQLPLFQDTALTKLCKLALITAAAKILRTPSQFLWIRPCCRGLRARDGNSLKLAVGSHSASSSMLDDRVLGSRRKVSLMSAIVETRRVPLLTPCLGQFAEVAQEPTARVREGHRRGMFVHPTVHKIVSVDSHVLSFVGQVVWNRTRETDLV